MIIPMKNSIIPTAMCMTNITSMTMAQMIQEKNHTATATVTYHSTMPTPTIPTCITATVMAKARAQ